MPTAAAAPEAFSIKGRTTEEVIAHLVANPKEDPRPVIEQLHQRFVARAARRAAKAEEE